MLDGRFRFENFVVGASNRLALAAARAVADAPAAGGQLAIHGPSGVGKTHLLSALGNAIRARHRNVAVGYLAVEPLMEDLHTAIATGQVELLLAEYAQWDVLLLDDVHLLSGRFETQYELLPVFTALRSGGRRIVLASDRRPADLSDLDERLRAQMSCETIVEMGPLDHETKVTILLRAREERQAKIDDDTIAKLAAASADAHALLDAFGALNAPPPPAAADLTAEPDEPLRVTPAPAINTTPPDISLVLEPEPQLVLLDDPPESPPVSAPSSRTPATPPVAHPTPSVTRPTPPPSPDEFEHFMVEIASHVSMSVDRWRTRLKELATHWAAEGFRPTMFERALQGTNVSDLGALEARFAAAVDRLRAMEREAARLDPKLAGLDVFRDPERIDDAEAVLLRAFAAYDPPPGPHREFTIESFIVGERNQGALRLASEVIAVPGTRLNPLFIHGAAESGKSHLLHAVGNALATRDGGAWTVAYAAIPALLGELRDSLHHRTLERWRARYRCADALLLDDVHALSGQARAQEEVLRLATALVRAGKQLVVTANAPQAELKALSADWRTWLDGGRAVEVGRVSESERQARHTPVPDGAEAAAPTIDVWFDEVSERTPPASAPVPAPTAGGVDSFFLDPEKCVADWPGLEGRVIEDPR